MQRTNSLLLCVPRASAATSVMTYVRMLVVYASLESLELSYSNMYVYNRELLVL